MTVDAVSPDTAWQWWQARRLSYNLALGLAGWVAYALTLLLYLSFGRFLWVSWQAGLSTTMLLGIGFLVLMAVANICYLIGPALEALMHPADPNTFRKSAYALGFWGSIALPFLFPAANLAGLIAFA